MSAIKNVTTCSDAEVQCLRLYLSGTNVSALALWIDGGATVAKGQVCGVEEIGGLETFWHRLGSVESSITYDTDRFRVRDAYRTLLTESSPDQDVTDNIKHYLRLLELGKLELTITVVESTDDTIICDGNKRTIACFAYAMRHSINDYALPVYVVSSS